MHRTMAIRYVDKKVMGRPAVRELLIKTIENIEKIRNSQKELDDTYNALIIQFSKLMEEPTAERVGRHKSTPFKAYWCKELSDSWKVMKDSQTAFKNVMEIDQSECSNEQNIQRPCMPLTDS